MKIIKKYPNAKYFRDLEKGTVFQFQSGGHTFMKTERIETGDFECNVVDLTNGSLEIVSEMVAVIPFNAELIIE